MLEFRAVFGQCIYENCQRCLHTTKTIDQVPGLLNAWFFILVPGYHIPPHGGPTKALVRDHLRLVVPAQAERCWIRVDDKTRHWENGRCLLFDDTYEHEVRNDTAEAKMVLFINVDCPLYSAGERSRRMVLALLRASSYVKRPLANLERRNRRLRSAGD